MNTKLDQLLYKRKELCLALNKLGFQIATTPNENFIEKRNLEIEYNDLKQEYMSVASEVRELQQALKASAPEENE